jgi:hypothetical protein
MSLPNKPVYYRSELRGAIASYRRRLNGWNQNFALVICNLLRVIDLSKIAISQKVLVAHEL